MTTANQDATPSTGRSGPRVLMAGPDVTGRGGMATVTGLLLRHGSCAARLRFVPTHVDGPVPLRLRIWLTGCATVLGLLAARRVDVLHLHVAERGSVARKGVLLLAARLAGVPVLLHCHGAEFVASHRALPAVLRRVVAAAFRRAALLVVLGETWRDTYVELLGVAPDRVLVLPNPVQLPTEVPRRGGDRVGAVFLGRYGARKGSPDLLRAVAALPPQARARLRLRLAGDGEVDDTRRRAAAVAADVQVGGWLDATGRDAALAGAEVFVLPSRDEGLPMALLEAMAWGLVPVVTPVGAIPEVVRDGDNGLLVDPGDVPALTAALQRLLCDDALRHRLAARARCTAESFSIESYVAELGAIWTRLAR